MGYIFSRPDDVIRREDPSVKLPTRSRKPPQDPNEESYRSPPFSLTAQWQDPYEAYPRAMRQPGPLQPSSHYGNVMLDPRLMPESMGMNISGFTLDYYQHPAKHADPKRLYRHAYDVYSLGILLLEIGIWKRIGEDQGSRRRRRRGADHDGSDSSVSDSEFDDEDHYARRRRICRRYLHRLRWLCGDTYANVVLSCLMIDISDSEVAMASQRELCARIVADLENCRA